MSNRARKRGPHTPGAGRGDRSALNGGKSPNTRTSSYTYEGAYRNKHFVHAITSLVGCVVELQKVNGEVYDGVLNTVSPQGDVVLEMATIRDKSRLKPTYIPTLCVSWNDTVSISSLSAASDNKDIFKIDGEIGTRQNGVSESRELQRFEFDDSSKIDDSNDTRLQGLDRKTGWNPDDMFDTNKEKFNVKTSFNPDMPDYTTTLDLQNNEADRQRILIASKKAREIEEESLQSTNLTDDTGTEEERYSAVKLIDPPSSQPMVCGHQNENEDSQIETETKVIVELSSNVESSMNIEGSVPLEGDVPPEEEIVVQVPNGASDTAQEVEPHTEQSESNTTETQDNTEETHAEIQESESCTEVPDSHTEEPQSHTESETTEEEMKKNSFKLNPDAMEFKPSTPVPSDTSSNTSPPNSQHNFSYNNSRVPRQKGPRGPRPPTFTDQPGIFGYQMGPLQPTALRPMFNPQTGLTTGQIGPAHLTSPTNLLMRQPLAAGSSMIGQQGHLYSPMVATQSPVMGMAGQQLYLSTSQPAAAMFNHPSMVPASGAGLAQSPQVLFVQPTVPGQPFGQGFIPPPQQLGGTVPVSGVSGAGSNLVTYNPVQSTQLGKQ